MKPHRIRRGAGFREAFEGRGQTSKDGVLQFLSFLVGACVSSGESPPAYHLEASITLGQLAYLGISYIFRS